jgi:hypothetical protein
MKLWRATLTMVFAGSAGLSFAVAALAVSADFESDGDISFRAGDSIDEYPDWIDVTGDSAFISPLAARTGQQSLRLLPGDPVAHAARLGPIFPINDSRTFWVTFAVRPVLKSDDALTTISVYGAKVGFLQGDAGGVVYAFDGMSQTIQNTGIHFADNGTVPADWFDLTLELYAGFWRLHQDGVPVTDWLGLDGDAGHALHWFGDTVADVFIDDLQVLFAGSDNPFLIGHSKDTTSSASFGGGADLVSVEEEPDPSTGDVSLSSTPNSGDTTVMSMTGALLIYVCQDTGDDSKDGLSIETAKATLPAGLTAVDDGGVIVVKASTSTYPVGTLSPMGKTITLRPDGLVRIQ